MRQVLGALIHDLPPFLWHLHRDWTLIRNRSESVQAGPNGIGVQCRWQWTSDLHVSKALPITGRRLLQRALRDWPIAFEDTRPAINSSPKVSFIMGHRGTSRIPHLLATLRSLAAQTMPDIECIVVEQSVEPELASRLPSWTRYVHTRVSQNAMPFSRAWALNVGARCARGELLVFHDNDMLVPSGYATEFWRRFQEGYQAINLKRFVFYLDANATDRFFASSLLGSDASSEAVVQNLEAGGSVAIGRESFFGLGGFDESFVGWGGEDNEFWERANIVRTWPFGYLPIVHLRHAPQPEKFAPKNKNLTFYAKRAAIDPRVRIHELKDRKFGMFERTANSGAVPASADPGAA